MILSRDRILTTHVGSLPRNEALSELLVQREAGESYDKELFDAEMEKAVRHVVAKQKEAGIDIGNDGEQQRVGFQTYVPQRMSGFGGESKRRRGREFEEFPELVQYLTRRFPNVSRQQNAPEAQGELHYHDTAAIEREIALFQRIAAEGKPFAEVFHDRAVARHHRLDHAQRLLRLQRSLSRGHRARDEQRISGDPQSRAGVCRSTRPISPWTAPCSIATVRMPISSRRCELHVAMINKGIEGIPPDRVRLHICYGNWEGPHIHDIALEKILPALYQAKVGALSIEFSNPRHAHEYTALKRVPFPKDMILIPGVVETTSNFVEHPEVVARRIEEAVASIGDRERVVASTDCGFGTFTRREWVIEPAVWLKLKSIRDGADIASARLWGRKSAA